MEQLEHKETQQPTEIVLEYRQPDYREVVEQYSYTLPKKRWLDMQLTEWEDCEKGVNVILETVNRILTP